MELRRIQAAEIMETECIRPAELARRLGVSRTTAGRWVAAYNKHGMDSVWSRQATGRPSFLTPGQVKELQELCLRNFFDGWTIAQLSEFIAEKFGVAYHRDHLYKLRKRIEATIRLAAS